MARCLLALGSNLGDRASMLRGAVEAVGQLPSCQLLARSCWYETVPVGGPRGQGAFLNGAILVETSVSPQELVAALLRIETSLGRERAVRWDARAIDIDLLLYGAEVITTPELMVPHPRMSFRRFVLEPSAEIAGGMVHAGSGWTIAGLLSHLRVSPRYVAITAFSAAVAGWLASRLVQSLGCPRLEETGANRASQGASGGVVGIESGKRRGESAMGLLRRSHWQGDSVLSARLPVGQGRGASGVLPVVSGFWSEALAVAGGRNASRLDYLECEFSVKPALVIAVDPGQRKKFSKRIFGKDEKNFVFPSMSSQEFCELLDRPGLGPLARIRADDPEVVVQEAMAAVGSAWL